MTTSNLYLKKCQYSFLLQKVYFNHFQSLMFNVKESNHSLRACFEKEYEDARHTQEMKNENQGYWTGYRGRGRGRFDLLISQFCPKPTCPPVLSRFMVLNNKKCIPKRLPLYQGEP